MFIKFGDKTKKIFVKKTKDKSKKEDSEENILYLDSGDRRAGAILGEDDDKLKDREKEGPTPPPPTVPRREEREEQR